MSTATRNTSHNRQSATAGPLLIHCVFLSCFDSAWSFFTSMLYHGGIRLHRADTLETADFLMTVTGSTVLISDTVFLDGSWRDAIAMLARNHGRVAFLLMAEEEDQPFVSDAADRGVFQIIWKPVRVSGLRRAIDAAHVATKERRLYRPEEISYAE